MYETLSVVTKCITRAKILNKKVGYEIGRRKSGVKKTYEKFRVTYNIACK